MTIQLFIGLGNPGRKYADNRHNFGFLALDEIAAHLKAGKFSEKFGGLVSRVGDLFLFKPQSFMNNSGSPAAQIASFYKIPPEQIYVFHDELDVALGKIKIKQGGGDGGHNGIKSLDAHLGKDYWRVRLGIGHPGHKDLVHDYVLSDFTKEESLIGKKTMHALSENIDLIIKDNQNLFMTKYSELMSSTNA